MAWWCITRPSPYSTMLTQGKLKDMAADALGPWVAKTSATMLLAVQDRYCEASNIRHTLNRQYNCWSLRCSWSITWSHKDNYKTIYGILKFWNLVGKDFHGKGFQLLVLSLYWEMVDNATDIFMFPKINSWWKWSIKGDIPATHIN